MHANLLLLLTFAGLTTLTAIILRVAQRMVVAAHVPAGEASCLRQFPRPITGSQASLIQRFDNWLTRCLYLSGTGMGLRTITAILLLSGFTLGGLAFVFTESPLFTLVGALLGIGSVLSYVWYTNRKRLRAFQDQFPPALDLLARAIRAGESFEQAIQLVCQSSHDPLATEFRRCANQLDMGLSVSATMEALNQRLGLMDVRIFSSAVAVHRESGGNIAETMERLARVIRDRMNYQRQLRAATGAGRISVMLIAALGPILFTYLFFLQPEYGQGLWQDSMGRLLLTVAIGLEVVGLIWVYYLLKNDY